MIPPLNQNPAEFEQLLEFYKELKPKNILEIGSYQGGTLYNWLKYASKGASVSSIDIQRINDEYYSEWNINDSQIKFYDGASQSQEALKFAEKLGPIDWLFIDGGHSYREVLYDWMYYSLLIQPGAPVILHDIYKEDSYIGLDGRVFPVEVHLLWKNHLKDRFESIEIIEPNAEDGGMGPGIGIIWPKGRS